MKRALLCLTACLAFAMTSWAQGGAGTAGNSGQDQTTPHKHHHGDHMGGALTGCVEKTDSGYAIKHGGKDIPVTGSDDLSAHVGHEVKLAGSWAAASTSGGAAAMPKTFNETGVTMVSEKCTDKMHKKNKKGSADNGTGTTTPK